MITPRDVLRSVDDLDWPWYSGDGITGAMPVEEAPGSMSTSAPSLAAIRLDTPLEKVKIVKPGSLPLPRPFTAYRGWLDNPVPNFQVPSDPEVHCSVTSENDVYDFRSKLLSQMLGNIYDANRVLGGTKLRAHRDNASPTNAARADLAIEVYYDEHSRARLPPWLGHTSGVSAAEEFAALKEHLHLRPQDSLFASAAEMKTDRVLAKFLRAMLELAHFENRWNGLPDPPTSLRPLMTQARSPDHDSEYQPETSVDGRESTLYERQRGVAIWGQVCFWVAICG